jgi:transposase-like protein
MNKKSNKFSPEVRERAVRMVQEHRGEYPSLRAAVKVWNRPAFLNIAEMTESMGMNPASMTSL